MIKIISGGQTGADFGGLLAGKALGVPTGGWAPKGWRVDHTDPRYPRGNNPMLVMYGLMMHNSPSYPPRTQANVRMADCTIIFMLDDSKWKELKSVGSNKTAGFCQSGNWDWWSPVPVDAQIKCGYKPYIVIRNVHSSFLDANIRVIWRLMTHVIDKKGSRDVTINVAGHRQSTLKKLCPEYDFEATVQDILVKALKIYTGAPA